MKIELLKMSTNRFLTGQSREQSEAIGGERASANLWATTAPILADSAPTCQRNVETIYARVRVSNSPFLAREMTGGREQTREFMESLLRFRVRGS